MHTFSPTEVLLSLLVSLLFSTPEFWPGMALRLCQRCADVGSSRCLLRSVRALRRQEEKEEQEGGGVMVGAYSGWRR